MCITLLMVVYSQQNSHCRRKQMGNLDNLRCKGNKLIIHPKESISRKVGSIPLHHSSSLPQRELHNHLRWTLKNRECNKTPHLQPRGQIKKWRLISKRTSALARQNFRKNKTQMSLMESQCKTPLKTSPLNHKSLPKKKALRTHSNPRLMMVRMIS